MADVFAVRLTARGYEADANGHVAGTVLLQYGQHARWECLRAAGIDHAELRARGIGPVSLEEQIRFHAEVVPGDELEVSCRFVWGERKTFRVEQQIRRSDGRVAADVTNVGGLLDLEERRLVPDAAAVWRSVARTPAVLGL
jgi:acyl-CoA thioester hydrolase